MNIFLKCSFLFLDLVFSWYSLFVSLFLFFHLMYGVQRSRVGKGATYLVLLLPPSLFPCHLVKYPLLKHILHLILVTLRINWHTENSPTWFLSIFLFQIWGIFFLSVQNTHTFKTQLSSHYCHLLSNHMHLSTLVWQLLYVRHCTKHKEQQFS